MTSSAVNTLKMGKFPMVALLLQVTYIILFVFFVDYSFLALPLSNTTSSTDPAPGAIRSAEEHIAESNNEIIRYYGVFQDIHVMMYIGFGFLMTFLRRYGYSSVGINMLLAALVVQWATLTGGWILHFEDVTIHVGMETLINAEFAAAAVLISFGAVLGTTSPLQLLILALIETAIFQVNEMIVFNMFEASDIGDSMVVHAFGAYFGLTVAWIIRPNDIERAGDNESAGYHSDIFSMLGTIFLWLYWPSFNSATADDGDAKYRAVINTYFSLASCAVTTFAVSALVHRGKFNMVHIQNSTLAGGVAIGTMADMIIQPWGALLVGMVAGTVSVLGFRYLTPLLSNKLRLHDTCGVHNLHGMPGVISGLGGVVCAALTSPMQYMHGKQYDAGLQAAALGTSIGMAIGGGIATGLILKLPIWDQPTGDELFHDKTNWLLPEQGVSLEGVESFSTGSMALTHVEAYKNTNKNENSTIVTPKECNCNEAYE